MWVNHTGPLYVILSAAKDLCGSLARSKAPLRMTAIISKCLSAIQGCCKVGNKTKRVGIKKDLSHDMNG